MLPAKCAKLREHKPGQKVTLTVHVTECGGDEHTHSSPTVDEQRICRKLSVNVKTCNTLIKGGAIFVFLVMIESCERSPTSKIVSMI